jgi:Flp pilus assembly protein TadG
MIRKFLKRLRFPRLGTSGSAAAEFAMIAPPFFLIMFATMETGLMYYSGMVLQNATVETAREIRTGQAQAANMTQAQFRTLVCNQISFLLSCDPSKLYIDVRDFTSFGGASEPSPIVNGQVNSNMDSFQMGSSSNVAGSDDIILVRVLYTYQIITPAFATYFANLNGNQRLITASVAFRNEPF